jgi:chromosome segregation ATPase
VHLTLSPCISSNPNSNKPRKKQKDPSSEDVTIHAFINAEGTRVFRLNNRIVTGKEVRNKLGKLGVHLGNSTSLILQSAVTELADSTDPLALGAVIAEASGLSAWAQEAAKAHAELESQEKDAQRISERIDTLQRTSVAARVEATKGEKYGQLEAEAEAAAEVCSKKLGAILAAATRKRDEVVEIHTKTVEQQAVLQQKASQAQQKLARVAEQQQSAVPFENLTDSTNSEAKKLRLARIAIEEEIQVVSDQLKSYAAATAALDTAHAREKDATQACELALREIQLLEQGLSELKSQSSSLEAAAKAQEKVASLKVQLLDAQRELAAEEVALQEAQHQLRQSAAEMEQTNVSLRNYKDLMELDSSDDIDLQFAELAASKAELQFKERALLAKQQQPPKLPNGIALPTVAQCFSFKDPAKAASIYAPALEVLAGRHLNIAVAQSTQQAAQLLSSGNARGLRIWALDTISYNSDRIQVHRQVAEKFPVGSVIVPMDLLSFNAVHKGVIAKAFGSHVFVSTVQIGRQVMEQYGIPSIALDGTVTSRGRLAGGWVPREQQLRGPINSKIRLDLDRANLQDIRSQLGELDATEMTLKAQIEAVAARSAAEDAVLKFKKAEIELTSGQKGFSLASKIVKTLEMELRSCQAVAAALGQARSQGGSSLSAAADQAARLRARISQQRALLDSLERDKADAASEIESATAACPPGGSQQDTADLQAAHAQLEERLKEIDHQLLQMDRNLRDKQQKRTVQHQEEESRLQQEVAAAAEALRTVAKEKATLGKQREYLENILKEMEVMAKEIDVVPLEQDQQSILTILPLDFSELESMVGDVRAAAAQHTSLLAELAALKSNSGSNRSSVDAVTNLRAAEIAERELALLRPHAETMHSVAEALAEGIQQMNPHAEKFNEIVFDTVASFFNDLTAELLPGIEVRVTRAITNDIQDGAAATIHRNGAQFSYRRREGTTAGEGNWVTGLEALSGGQRTLISLAYLAASKTIGGDFSALTSSGSVLLADEVDAALDTTNQECAARLLSMLCSSKHRSKSEKPPLAQVICISHSPIFQQICDNIIKLTRNSEDGSTMLASN